MKSKIVSKIVCHTLYKDTGKSFVHIIRCRTMLSTIIDSDYIHLYRTVSSGSITCSHIKPVNKPFYNNELAIFLGLFGAFWGKKSSHNCALPSAERVLHAFPSSPSSPRESFVLLCGQTDRNRNFLIHLSLFLR